MKEYKGSKTEYIDAEDDTYAVPDSDYVKWLEAEVRQHSRLDELLDACARYIEENELEDRSIEFDGTTCDGHTLLTNICTATMTEEEWNNGYCHDCTEDDCQVSLDDSCKKTRVIDLKRAITNQ